VDFLFGPLRVVASVLALGGVLSADGPTWYVLYQALLGLLQFVIALAMLAGNRRAGGIFRCYVCDRSLVTRSIRANSGKIYHHYYSCPSHNRGGNDACTNRKNRRAVDVEGPVWELVSGLLRDPERLRAGLNEMIEAERAGMHGDPEAETLAWWGRLDALDSKRSRYQDMAAEGHITFDELGAKLRGLEAERATVEGEFENLQLRRSRVEELERDKASPLDEYAGMVSEELDELTGEERHQIDRMLRLRVRVQFDDTIEVEGILSEAISTPMDTRLHQAKTTKSPDVRFRTFLSRDGAERLELMKVD
jgi:hypothetical protein